MPVSLRPSSAGQSAVSRPLVAGLFVSSVLLSVVSWYKTQQGMALYLSPWFSFLASLGVLIDMNLSPSWVEALRVMGCGRYCFGGGQSTGITLTPLSVRARRAT